MMKVVVQMPDDGTDDEQYDDGRESLKTNLPLPKLPEKVLCRLMPCVVHILQDC